MERVVRVLVVRIFVALLSGALVVGAGAPAFAKEKPKSPPSGTAKGKPPPGQAVNACGCYRTESGACVCTDKKGKCECPGDCEPVGCGEKRDKELEREMAAEIKRAQDDEKRREADREAKENGAKENGAKETEANGTASPDAGEPPPPVAAKSGKARKDAAGKSDSKAEKK